MQTQQKTNQTPQAPTAQPTNGQLSANSPNSYTSSYQTSSSPSPPTVSPATTTSSTVNTDNTGMTNTGISGSDYKGGWSVPTVENELNKITSSDSLTMQQARNAGMRAAGSRGLLNSSIAGQSAEQAAIQAALPMAQQNVQNQLQQQQFAQGVTANTQGQYMQSTKDIMEQALISINEIETATDIPQEEKDKMIANTIKRRDADLKFLQNYYSMMPTWSGNWVNFPVMPSAPGTG